MLKQLPWIVRIALAGLVALLVALAFAVVASAQVGTEQLFQLFVPSISASVPANPARDILDKVFVPATKLSQTLQAESASHIVIARESSWHIPLERAVSDVVDQLYANNPGQKRVVLFERYRRDIQIDRAGCCLLFEYTSDEVSAELRGWDNLAALEQQSQIEQEIALMTEQVAQQCDPPANGAYPPYVPVNPDSPTICFQWNDAYARLQHPLNIRKEFLAEAIEDYVSQGYQVIALTSVTEMSRNPWLGEYSEPRNHMWYIPQERIENCPDCPVN